ncbi:AGE family epimerase/isomerase [Nitratireductor aquimarinus]|uniref:AGE family epimerase/isomerase n=1 Tax=Nitratireductor aquimarinus TaxID=889300 RepID=UPI002935E1D6|nr:AGE family epimerase/isomerase [Nitratireductor aquimarinus]MDV2968147.1 AGE family epimerase/isomerase [Nitratireductor aquimarinus]
MVLEARQAGARVLPFDDVSFERWLLEHALPLWAEAGMHKPNGGVWEALSHEGVPVHQMPKRVRVQARQAYVFASAEAKWPNYGHAEAAEHAFHFLAENAFDRRESKLAALLESSGRVLDETQDLYDLAFMLLALSSLWRSGRKSIAEQWLPQWEKALAAHEDSQGWRETPCGRLPRRQNPHMHLFEASLAFYEVSGLPRFLDIAKRCLALFRDCFYSSENGLILEYFGEDWSPLAELGQVVEPGHMVEWVHLLGEYERVSKDTSGVDLRYLYDKALLVGKDRSGRYLVNRVSVDGRVIDGARRLWPQTEYLKASIMLSRLGERLPIDQQPNKLLENISISYLDVPVMGGWYDNFDDSGKLASEVMPSSSFYHLWSAFEAFAQR